MDDKLKYWTSVGSAGTLDEADLAKVSLHQSIVQLGAGIALPPQAAAIPGPGVFPTIQAVVRYNVTPVDGLFFTGHLFYELQIRCRGQITAKLMQVDLASGTETPRITLESNTANFEMPSAWESPTTLSPQSSVQMDFVHSAYYVEATLTAPAVVIGHPAAISIVKVFPAAPFI